MTAAEHDPRADRNWPALLDVAPESLGIDLAEVRQYRLGRGELGTFPIGFGATVTTCRLTAAA